jgi:septum site-determining protein MinC
MTQANPFELEGMVSTVTVLRLLTTDVAAIRKALLNKVEQMPGFFQDAPVALDLSVLEGTDEDSEEDAPAPRREVDLGVLAAMLRELRLVPVGVRALREARRTAARAAGLGTIRGSGRKAVRAKEAKADEPAKAPAQAKAAAPAERRNEPERRREAAPDAGPALLLRVPLRSGQVVYAEQCDAIVLAPVNAGAELIADGNIHVYGALRGRALAGAHGNEEARIFCKSLEADLVAIAGCYLRADEIPEARRGKPAQIYLENDKLIVADL